MAKVRPTYDDRERPETMSEFHRRVQDQMDEDSWAGRSTVAAEFPQRGIVHESEPNPDVPHIWKWRRKYGDGH